MATDGFDYNQKLLVWVTYILAVLLLILFVTLAILNRKNTSDAIILTIMGVSSVMAVVVGRLIGNTVDKRIQKRNQERRLLKQNSQQSNKEASENGSDSGALILWMIVGVMGCILLPFLIYAYIEEYVSDKFIAWYVAIFPFAWTIIMCMIASDDDDKNSHWKEDVNSEN